MKPIPPAWQEHDRQIRPYVCAHQLIGGCRTVLALALLVLVLATEALPHLESVLDEAGFRGFALFWVFYAVLIVLWEGLSLPFSVAHYLVERAFGVSRQGFGAWLWDQAKGWAVAAGLGTVALLFTWFCATSLGETWWVALWAFSLFFSVILAQLAPVLLLPIFFKMDPLPEGSLREKLVAMSRDFGISIREIYLLGLGQKTEKGNAAFMGLGKTKRIAIGDTIYQKYPTEQVLAVFGHELGHMVHQDIWKGLGFSALALFLTFALAQWICETWIFPAAITWIQAPFGLFLFFLMVSMAGLVFGFIERAYSRWRERLADEFASAKLKMGEPLGDALEALTYQNRSYFVPNAWREFFLFSHPAPWRRILALRSKG